MKTTNLIKIFKEKNYTISTMESCTGGALASEITNHPNSSDIFKFGAVTYSNEYKIKFGVDEKTINKYSVYSQNVATEMAKAICNFTGSTIGVGITGKLGRIDKNNICTSENNKVYITIYNSQNKKQKLLQAIVDGKTRSISKKQILNIAINEIIDFANN